MKASIWTRAAMVLALCTATACTAWGQATNSGDIRGTVTDSTGALVPGVTVTVVNTQTGITKVLTTNKDGLYDTSSIVVGQYSVTFDKPGFAQFERTSISLEVGVSTVNAQLKIGSNTEKVEVNTDLPLLDTESGTQQTTLEAKSMAVLPNVGQDWQNFTILLPGASGGTSNGTNSSTNPGQEISANGNLPYSNVLADGASTTLSHSQNSDVSIFETVAELQVSTSSFSAEYGIGGIIFNQISKGGTSQFHGSGYDYFQSTQFNAQNEQINTTAASPLYSHRYNNFGGSVGGPVLLPYIKHKAFFFFNYDQIVSHGASGASTIRDIPTVAVMSGDFTGQPTLYDPTTQILMTDAKGNKYPVRQSFAAEYGNGNKIPAALFDKVSANFQKFYPTPTNHIATGVFLPGRLDSQGQLQQNFQSAVPASNPYRRYFGRLDYDINPKNRLTISVTQRDTPVVAFSDTTACPIGCENQDIESYNPQISEVWTISPHTINEVRLGYTFQGNFYSDDASGKGIPAQLGFQYAKADTIPSIEFTNNYPYTWIGPAVNAVYKEHIFTPSDVVTMIRGKHVLHFGGEIDISRDDSTDWGNQNAGTFQFNGAYTQQWTLTNGVASSNGSTGTDYADFLLGYANNWGANVSPEYGARLKTYGAFIQDDYKIRPNFTLNIGLRYQVRHGWSETHGNEDTYDPTIINPANNTPGAFWYATTHTNGRLSLEDTKYTTVLPRAGFSWLVHPGMTFRGGFGLYAYNLSLDTYGGGLGALADATGNYGDQSGGVTPATLLDGPGTIFGTTTPLPYTAAENTSPTRYNGQDIGYTQYDAPDPKIYQYNLNIQQAIGSNTSFQLAYVGSHGFNLNFPTDLNQVPTALLGPNDYSLRPNVNFNNIGGSTNNAISNYNSMQVSFDRRLARGISFNFNYTWSHFLDDQDSSGFGNREGPQNRQYADAASNYSNSNFDTRNSFKGMVVYEIPVGKGRLFFNHNSLVDAVFGGYQVSSTMQLHSGNPFTVFAANHNQTTYAENPGDGNYAPFANYNGMPLYGPGMHTSFRWYNPAAFTSPANGTFGNTRRNFLYGPGIELINISAGKKFDIYENVKLQIRLDATNAFNHTNLSNPNGTFDALTAITPAITNAQSGPRNLQAGVRLEF